MVCMGDPRSTNTRTKPPGRASSTAFCNAASPSAVLPCLSSASARSGRTSICERTLKVRSAPSSSTSRMSSANRTSASVPLARRIWAFARCGFCSQSSERTTHRGRETISPAEGRFGVTLEILQLRAQGTRILAVLSQAIQIKLAEQLHDRPGCGQFCLGHMHPRQPDHAVSNGLRVDSEALCDEFPKVLPGRIQFIPAVVHQTEYSSARVRQ